MTLLRWLLFRLPPELAHFLVMEVIRIICSVKWFRELLYQKYHIQDWYAPWAHRHMVAGMALIHPVGLAAGFDKNGKYLRELETLGFSFVEIGTVTLHPQKGYPRPRIWRLPNALMNRMGLPNQGAAAVVERLNRYHRNKMKVGVSLGKSNLTPVRQSIREFSLLVDIFAGADYLTLNLSCPTQAETEQMQNSEYIRALLLELKTCLLPIFIKLSPSLSDGVFNDIFGEVHFADKTSAGRRGLILTNSQPTGSGGLTGSIQEQSLRVLRLYASYAATVGRKVPVIASGGIMSKEYKKKAWHGADLYQIYTGFVYHGPKIIKELVLNN